MTRPEWVRGHAEAVTARLVEVICEMQREAATLRVQIADVRAEAYRRGYATADNGGDVDEDYIARGTA